MMNQSEASATAARAPAAGKRKSRTATVGSGKPAKAAKESRGFQLLCELFLLAKVDLRSSEHASGLARELGGLLKGTSVLVLVSAILHGALACWFVVSWASGCVSPLDDNMRPFLLLGSALDVVSFTVTAPGAGPTAMAAVAGDSAQVRNSQAGALVRMVAMWTKAQAVGRTQITTPSMHDVTRGFQYRNVANQPGNMVPRGIFQVFKPQDVMSVAQVGSAVGGDVELAHVVVLYDDLPGVKGEFIDSAQLAGRMVNLLAVEDTTTATAASAYSGPRLLNQNTNLLKANTLYALLGAKIGAACGALCVQGSDIGNLRVAIPGLTSPDVETVNWFVQMSEWLGLPLIPVFNSANAGNIIITNVQDENLTAVPFSLIFAELAGA